MDRIYLLQGDKLLAMLDEIATREFGMTRAQAWNLKICIRCKKDMRSSTEAEYKISGLCDPCFKEATAEDTDDA